MIENNRQILISCAGSRKAAVWQKQNLYWSDFAEKLKTPARSTETLAEYMALPKSKQDDLKDVGGFVAGELKIGRRKAANVISRDLITLDLDNLQPGSTKEILRRVEALGCGYAVYSTRKHDETKPRLRVIVPLDRRATADEYEPIARKLAAIIGIDLCDPTTFEASRLMYWPSCCADGQYVYQFADRPFLSADGILSMYTDWRNYGEWPQVPGHDKERQHALAKQQDPLTKPGVVGAFCKTYDIYGVMQKFLPGVYEPVDGTDDRFTYVGGSTVGGAVIYENGKFIYSHHATDPGSGKLLNAFDFLRVHKFGELDDDAKPDTPVNKLPSYIDACKLAVADETVSAILSKERYDKALESFSDLPENVNTDWLATLEKSAQSGEIQKTIDNILIILCNDPMLKNKIAFDEFSNRGVVLGSLPWNQKSEIRRWSDVDDAGAKWYLEKVYRITGENKLFAGLALCAAQNTINPVQDYINSLKWDGIKRLDTLFIDYLGAKDTKYVRAATRKSITAMIARAMVPGIKFDTMPILSGPQGLGKSTLLRILGRKWYSDSLQSFEGKEAAEMIQGILLNELGELNGLSRSETNAVKQFLSKVEDIYREPFGRRTNNYPRRCVFFGTTNDVEFLKDRTGNRRFWPIDVGINAPTKNVFKDLEKEVDQVLAEATIYWKLGEPLFLSGEVEEEAKVEQEAHRESNAKEGLIREFLERPIPLGWEKRTLVQRSMYWSGDFARGNEETIARDRVCALEIWCECFNGDIKHMKRSDALEINSILGSLEGWKRHNSTMRFGYCGAQRGFIKV